MTRLATVKCTRCGAVMAMVVNVPADSSEPIPIRCGWEDKRVCPSWVAQHKSVDLSNASRGEKT